MAKSANTYVHKLQSGYSPKADGPKNPPKAGFVSVRTADSGRFVTQTNAEKPPKRR